MTGQLINFQEAKDRILGTNVSVKDDNLDAALVHFSFSRLPKRERIARIVAEIFSRQGIDNQTFISPGWVGPELDSVRVEGHYSFLNIADEIAKYAAADFTKPYESPALAVDPAFTDEEVADGEGE